MGNGVEEEEFRDLEGLNQHTEACGDNGDERNDVADSDDVEGDVAWAGQRALEEWHFESARALVLSVVGVLSL